jgi:BCD family chlorophyll transporter-like MFS transporter
MGILVFGAWGMGYNFASVSYFSLATEISGEKGRSRTIAVMFFMMIVSIIGTSIALGEMLEDYSPDKLINSFQIIGLIAFAIAMVGIIGLESRKAEKESAEETEESHTWGKLVKLISGNKQATRFFLYLIVLLTAVFAQDIFLEPYGAEAFDLDVRTTTRITSIWGTMFLISLSLGSIFENRVSKLAQARLGAWSGIVAFGLIVVSSIVNSLIVFYIGVVLLGLATGLSTVSNLSIMLDMTIAGKVGLFIGAWGMASAVSRLIGNVMGGVVRDAMTKLVGNAVVGYSVVFVIEIGLLLISLFMLRRVDVNLFKKQVERQMPLIERAAVSSEV